MIWRLLILIVFIGLSAMMGTDIGLMGVAGLIAALLTIKKRYIVLLLLLFVPGIIFGGLHFYDIEYIIKPSFLLLTWAFFILPGGIIGIILGLKVLNMKGELKFSIKEAKTEFENAK